ncbi:MAG TPA: DUF3443 domain-containing protein [Paraburkholderia sp.]
MRTKHSAVKLKDWMRAVAAVMLVSVLAACGGGGGSSSNNNSSTTLNGGSLPASPTQQPIAATAANTVPITVGQGLSGVVNLPMVSVLICQPNTSNCATVNNIQVDTGSFGLRVVASALNLASNGTTVLNALQPITLNGAQLAECATFADGYTWGTVRTASVQIGGETAAGIPMQIIGDMAQGTVPSTCSNKGTAENTTGQLGANGILGIGTAPTDCGAACAASASGSNYFTCPSGASCVPTAVPLNQQVANPVANFPLDNNGVIVQMPPILSVSGAAPSATGTLVFGIGTQSNNALIGSGAQIYTTDPFGDLNDSVYNGTTVQAFLDSGSNAYFFSDSSLATPPCPSTYAGFYCPSSAQTRSVTLVGVNKATTTASIGILSAQTLFGGAGNYAFNDLAGQIGGNTSFDLGLPFFYGRHVYYGIDRTQGGVNPGGQAPFVAF